MQTESFKVEHGLDPRSTYPRCDFCGRNERASVQVGRWWAHQSCAESTANQRLLSAQLPKLDYHGEPLITMRRRIQQWAAKRMADLRTIAASRGDALMNYQQTQYTNE